MCGSPVGFNSETLSTQTLENAGQPGLYRRFNFSGQDVHYCANSEHGACNWIVPANGQSPWCVACELNRTIPNLSEPGSLPAWTRLEQAKKRLVYSLLRMGLPIDSASTGRLTFDFLRDAVTGHEDGVITIDVMKTPTPSNVSVSASNSANHTGHCLGTCGTRAATSIGRCWWQKEAASKSFARCSATRVKTMRRLCRAIMRTGLRQIGSFGTSRPTRALTLRSWAETWAHYLHMLEALDTAAAENMEPKPEGEISHSHRRRLPM